MNTLSLELVKQALNGELDSLTKEWQTIMTSAKHRKMLELWANDGILFEDADGDTCFAWVTEIAGREFLKWAERSCQKIRVQIPPTAHDLIRAEFHAQQMTRLRKKYAGACGEHSRFLSAEIEYHHQMHHKLSTAQYAFVSLNEFLQNRDNYVNPNTWIGAVNRV